MILKSTFFLSISILILCGCASNSKNDDMDKKAQIYYAEGTTALIKGRYKDALRELLDAEKLDGKNPKILVNLGMAYYFIGQKDVALSKLEKALEIDPKNSDARLNLGSFYQEQGRFPEAMRAYESVIKDLIYPQHFRAYYNMALIEEKKGNIASAKQFLSKAIEDSENYCPAHYQLGLIWYQEREYRKALDSFSNATQGSCINSPEAFYHKALSQEALGKYREAIGTFEFLRDRFTQSNYFSIANYHLQNLRSQEERVESAQNQTPVYQAAPVKSYQAPKLNPQNQ